RSGRWAPRARSRRRPPVRTRAARAWPMSAFRPIGRALDPSPLHSRAHLAWASACSQTCSEAMKTLEKRAQLQAQVVVTLQIAECSAVGRQTAQSQAELQPLDHARRYIDRQDLEAAVT